MARTASWRAFLLALTLTLGVACSQPTSEELLGDAREALAAGEIRTANIHLRNLLQQDAEHVEARAMLAGVALAMGDFAGAEQAARRAIDLGVDPIEVYLVLLQALEAQAKYNEILVQFVVGPELPDAQQSVALTVLGSARQNLGDSEGAEEAFRQAVELAPESADTRTRLASLLLATGRADEARQIASAVLRTDSGYSPALLLRASLEAASSRTDAAMATLREVMELEQTRQRGAQYLAAAVQLVGLQMSQGDLDAADVTADLLLAANAQHPVARFVKANLEFEQGLIDGAETRVQGIVATFPQYWPAYRLQGMIDVEQDQLGQAEQNLRTAANNNDLLARLQLAELYVRQGDIEQARQLFPDSDAAQQLGDGLFLAAVGGASLQAGQSELAASYFEHSELLDAEDTQQLVNMVQIFVAAGEHERALRLIEESSLSEAEAGYLSVLVQLQSGDTAAAEAIAKQLMVSEPELAWPYNLRGLIALGNSEVDTARDFFASGLEREPENVATLLGLARVELADENPAAAEQRLLGIVAIAPTQTNALFGLAQLSAVREDFEAARSWLGQAPDSALRSFMMGQLDVAEGNFGSATQAFGAAYDAQPNLQFASNYYAAAQRAGRADADRKLLEWVRANPLDPGANFLLGGAALAANDYEAAVDRYETVLVAEPAHAATLNNLAWLYGQRGDDNAVEYAERAYAAEPENPAIADTLGWLVFERGDTARAAELLEQAATGVPDNAEIQYHFAAALAETGDADRARAILTQVLAGPAQFTERADAEARLQDLGGPAAQP